MKISRNKSGTLSFKVWYRMFWGVLVCPHIVFIYLTKDKNLLIRLMVRFWFNALSSPLVILPTSHLGRFSIVKDFKKSDVVTDEHEKERKQ